MPKKKKVFKEIETQEQKEARWAKSNKMAKSFAKQAGLLKQAKDERKHNELIKSANHRRYWED
ncbi:MAG: hypothetical protein HUJ61_06085 [Bacilli bacterium]|nr:hypothetical protein [Bacilli bacterium]